MKLLVNDKIDIKSCDFEHHENQAVNYELITNDIVLDLNSNNKYRSRHSICKCAEQFASFQFFLNFLYEIIQFIT